MPTVDPSCVCVYCASSQRAAPEYYAAAADLGRIFAQAGVAISYGGGAVGMMGALADAALQHGGKVTGVLPGFMDELELGHRGVTELVVVEDMHGRKRKMIELADAIVALPGGCGTLEELLEAITWKRLGLHAKPIVLVNTRDFFRPLVDMLDRSIEERFMGPAHADMWALVDRAEDVLPAIQESPPWDADAARSIANS